MIPRILYEDYDTEMGIKLPSIQIRITIISMCSHIPAFCYCAETSS